MKSRCKTTGAEPAQKNKQIFILNYNRKTADSQYGSVS